ncbi:hypothetical protein DAPPUDRAFT_226226 [Daphnia pulex]|uniref:Uncharacterized protein n=1 Tax=Daphnia pulex TaxID=6669 RepID=E9GXJ7_DAPPU|nr:hypothetical protein DAPPUDRAFT_226226 [Daphnia pulex]|eukprot:EFX75797.1 hypothetical protein DAPPUDRAFT_226226 [Daphnia pulex]
MISGNAISYALLAGVCLSAHLLRGVGSLPVPTTTTTTTTSTESPPISPAVSSDADTNESTAEASREVSYYTAVASTSRQESGEGSRTYSVATIFKRPAPSPESDNSSTDEQPTDPNLPLSSAVVSSSTAEGSCSSGVVQPGPCRKRSASTERISKEVLDYYMLGAKRSLREANPSSENWAVPNLEKSPGHNETSSDSNSQSRQSRQSSHSRDSDSPSPESSNQEASSASKSSSDSSSTDKSQPGTPM